MFMEKTKLIIRVETKSGSIYLLDKEAMTWHRENAKYSLRSVSGQLLEWPEIVVGAPMHLWGPPFVPEADLRLIYTTDVVNVSEVEPANE